MNLLVIPTTDDINDETNRTIINNHHPEDEDEGYDDDDEEGFDRYLKQLSTMSLEPSSSSSEDSFVISNIPPRDTDICDKKTKKKKKRKKMKKRKEKKQSSSKFTSSSSSITSSSSRPLSQSSRSFLSSFKNRLQIMSPPKISPIIIDGIDNNDKPPTLIEECPSTSSSSSESESSPSQPPSTKRLSSTKQEQTNTKQTPSKRVSFSTVEIREYGLVVGDHPLCKEGLPLSLDWKYNPETTIERIDVRFCRKRKKLSQHKRERGRQRQRDHQQRRRYQTVGCVVPGSSSSSRHHRRGLKRLSPKQRRERLQEVTGLNKTQIKVAEKERKMNAWTNETFDFFYNIYSYVQQQVDL